MKKKYEKPQVYMEKFELAEHIAGCSLTINIQDPMSCVGEGYIQDDYMNSWFIDGNTSCKVEVEGYCYTNGSINVATINS